MPVDSTKNKTIRHLVTVPVPTVLYRLSLESSLQWLIVPWAKQPERQSDQ